MEKNLEATVVENENGETVATVEKVGKLKKAKNWFCNHKKATAAGIAGGVLVIVGTVKLIKKLTSKDNNDVFDDDDMVTETVADTIESIVDKD